MFSATAGISEWADADQFESDLPFLVGRSFGSDYGSTVRRQDLTLFNLMIACGILSANNRDVVCLYQR